MANIVFTATDSQRTIDADSDVAALIERVQIRADAEDTGHGATPHYLILLWKDGNPDSRVLHVYGNTQRGHATDPRMTNENEFDLALDEATNGKYIDGPTVAVANTLVDTLRVMNSVDGLAYQRPGSAYQHTVDALKATLAVAVGSAEIADTVYDGILDSGESAEFILKINGYRAIEL